MVKTSPNKQNWFTKMSDRMPCNLTSTTRRTMTIKQMPKNWQKKNICMSYSLKQTTKEAKFPLQNFGGLGSPILKRPYQLMNIWFAKPVQTKHKCLIVWDYSNSHPNNSYPMYKLRHGNGSPTRKSPLHTMFCTPENDSVKTRSQSLITITIMRHPVHLTLPYDHFYQSMKRV